MIAFVENRYKLPISGSVQTLYDEAEFKDTACFLAFVRPVFLIGDFFFFIFWSIIRGNLKKIVLSTFLPL